MRFFLAVSLALALLACSGQEGTISVRVVSAPDSLVIPRIETLRVTLAVSGDTFESTRDADGVLRIAIDVEADGRSGDLVVEGFDETGATIAVGRVGPLPLSAIDASVAVYLAAPQSIAEAPVSLEVPRSHIGGTEASFGALLAGGLDEDGPVDAVDVYSTYLHELQLGLPMPEARSAVSVTTGSAGFVYMLGGNDEQGVARSESFAFDTTIPPAGSYRPLVISAEHARSGASLAVVGQEQFLVSGDPALLLDGVQGTIRPLPDGAELDAPAATVVSNNQLQVVFGGLGVTDSSAAIYQNNQVTHVSAPPELLRTQHRAITLPTQEVLFVGGAIGAQTTTTAVLYKAGTGTFQTIELLATGRRNPAIALTDRYLLVAGGEDDAGNALADAELFDVATLEPIATMPLLLPRKNAVAFALNNGQILIAGGQDDTGAPIALLGLFTPQEP